MNPRFFNLKVLIFVMTVNIDKVVDEINKDDVSEILIINCSPNNRAITFLIKLTTGFYLIPCQIIYKLDKETVGIELYKVNYYTTHKKLFSIYRIKKYIKEQNLRFVIITNDMFDSLTIKAYTMQIIKLK